MTTTDIAWRARQRQFWQTPYRTGNLAQSVGEIVTYFNESHYKIFNAIRDAEYGEALNEQPIMKMTITENGRTRTITYRNKHFKWIDRYVGNEAVEIDIDLGTVGSL